MKNHANNNCIALDELEQLILNKKQEVKIIDVRNSDEYQKQHIPGAINISVTNIDIAEKLFDKMDYLITACGKGGGRSAEATEKLQLLGFSKAIWLCGGTIGWNEK